MLKTHYIYVLTYYSNRNKMGTISYVELAGSENASTDHNIITTNDLSQNEKKNIARSFNALSVVLTDKIAIWEESVLLQCLRPFL